MKEKPTIGEIIEAALPLIQRVARLFFWGKRARATLRAIVAILTIVKDGLPPDDIDADTFVVTYGQIKNVGKNKVMLRDELAQLQRELQNDNSRANAIG